MKIRGAFVASRAILSSPENSMSLIDLVETLSYVGVPEDVPEDATVYGLATFVVMHDTTDEAEKHAGPFPAKFWIETPKGRRLERDIEMDFMGSIRSRVILQLSVLPYAGPGTYAFCFEGPAGLASWEVEVTTSPQPEGDQVNASKLKMQHLPD